MKYIPEKLYKIAKKYVALSRLDVALFHVY